MQANELFDRPNTILLDGGMGTMLQAAGLKLGPGPGAEHHRPKLIESIHGRYAAAGSRIINANTFGASPTSWPAASTRWKRSLRRALPTASGPWLPMAHWPRWMWGRWGELLEPNGTLAFEDAVAEYGRIVRAGVAAGADLVFFETFTDLYELKAALLAAKENSTLPIMASMSFQAMAAPLRAARWRALRPRPGAWGPTPWASTARWDPKRSSPWQSS